MDTTVLTVDMARRRVADLTDEVERFCHGRGDGLCSVFAPHATAGLALMETGAGSDDDLDLVLAQWLPRHPTATGTARTGTGPIICCR